MLSHSTLGDLQSHSSYSTPKVPVNLRHHIQHQKRQISFVTQDKCCICLHHETPLYITLFPCNHRFHGPCLIKWMRSENRSQFTCPLCRQNIGYFVNNSFDHNKEQINQQLNEIWEKQYEYKISDQDENKNNTAAKPVKLNAKAKAFKPVQQDTLSPVHENKSFKYSLVSAESKNNSNQSTNECMDGYVYDPDPLRRARGNIQISRALTTKIIPALITENISNLYAYMDRMTAMNNICVYDDVLCVIDYGFHEKTTNDIIYCVANKQNQTKNRNYQWRMHTDLWKQQQLENIFGITADELPSLPMLNVTFYAQLDYKQVNNIISETKWHKIPIFNKSNVNKSRITLSLTKEEFIQQCKHFIEKQNNNHLIPILLFNSAGQHRVEYVQIIQIDYNGINDVGISYEYINDNIKVAGIHLDKNSIMKSHQLVSCKHVCQCLDKFASFIDMLHIGNPDTTLNRLKDSQKRNQMLKNENRMLKAELQKRLQLTETV